ncbi:ParB/Srx family N-terminal domain-containing protein [Devosia ginsengisoli]|uniref:ParB/Srx family N-terminal domain-containing protein n=1 Tax=Devosia ginsengisoli TaxID=400770 RepID=UPI0026EE5C4C|nr:ParB/Srx family N-terminal domain-containing protein [Devosia ginsengisoli]MCR6673248.1 ParB/Srx family N-terminal domain-containing protein [Devosia ginsengisoli]
MSEKQTIAVEVRPVADLVPYERNARKHPADKVRKLADLIGEFGWTAPILADDAGIVAGHRRRLAAMLIYAEGGVIRLPGGQELPAGMVPVVDCTGWSDEQRRAYILADNQTTLEGEWDEDLLRLELTFLDGAGYDLTLTGFDGAALEAALAGPEHGGSDEPDPLKVTLSDRFGVAPFSVLNAREGWWQDRKRAWLALGIQSEVGRGENLLKFSDTINEPDPAKRARKKAQAHG